MHLTDFNRDFITYIDQLEALRINKQVQYIGLLAGDYNIDLLHYEINQINQFLNIIYTHGMFPCTTLPTRITDHSATLIDNIYINRNTPLAGIFVSAISDHLPIFLFINLKKSPKKIGFKKVTNINFDKLDNNLKNHDFPDFKMFSDVNAAYNSFLYTIQTKKNRYTYTFNQKIKLAAHNWITPGIINSCRKKNALYKKFINRIITRETFTSYKNLLTTVVRSRKKNFIRVLLTNKNKIFVVYGNT